MSPVKIPCYKTQLCDPGDTRNAGSLNPGLPLHRREGVVAGSQAIGTHDALPFPTTLCLLRLREVLADRATGRTEGFRDPAEVCSFTIGLQFAGRCPSAVETDRKTGDLLCKYLTIKVSCTISIMSTNQ